MGTENIKLRILWLSWKDVHNPLAGGAEVISDALMSRLVKDGHEVRLITAGFPGSKSSDKINGYGVTRVGSRQSVYWQTFRHVRKNLKEWPDLVVEEVNTIPFFSKFYLKKPRVLFFHMLCRQIWFYQMVFPFSLIGYLIEPLYLRLIKQGRVIAMSGSTKQDLMRSGFKARDITVISEGIEIPMLKNLNSVKKFAKPTMLSLGAMRGMKRTDHQIKAFEIAKQSVPDLQLIIAGDSSGRYGQKVLRRIKRSKYAQDIKYKGRVSLKEKIKLLQKSHFITVTSVKEGWGLIVTEAASQGTPAIVYDVDGLRDSVKDGETGYVTSGNSPLSLACEITQLQKQPEEYNKLCKSAWDFSKLITFDNTYRDFKQGVKL